MKMANQRVRDMTSGTPWRLLLNYMVPLMIGNLFQQVYNMVDTVVVGRFLGVDALAGAGSTGSISFLVMGFCMGMCSGFAIPVAQKFGEKDFDGLRKYVGNMIWLGGIVALVVTVATTLLCWQILIWMDNPAETIQYAYDYIFWIFLGIPFTMLYNTLAGIIRSLGDSKTPLKFLIFSSGLNIVLDIVFIVVFKMGVAGASLATVVAQIVSGALCLWVIIRDYPILHLNRETLKPQGQYIRRLFSMGVPMGLQFSITAIGNTILQTAVNGLGTASMAAMTAGSKVGFLFDGPLNSIGGALTTYSGQNLGAGKLDRVRRGVRSALFMGIIYAVVIFFAVCFLGKPVSLLFLEPGETEVIELCRQYLICNALFYILLLFVNCLRMTIQGLGFSGIAVIAGVLEMFARGGVGVLLVPVFGFNAVSIGSPAAWVFANIFLIPTYLICMRKLETSQKGVL